MGKKFRNECFRVAVDYLYDINAIKTDKELAAKIEVTPATLSRIRKDLSEVSEETLRKMNDAFGGIFNMAYFRGESTYFLVKDAMAAKATPQPTSQQETNILEVYAHMIRSIDDLRQELKKQIAEVQALNSELRQTITHLKGKGITYQSPDEAPRLAAEQ